MKFRITIKGRVHDVGYRPFLLGLAESLEVDRFFADNIFIDGKQAVEILVDDEEDKVKAFVDLIRKKKPENAGVEEVEVEEYDGSVMKTESYYRYLTAMQLAKIATYGGKMLEKQDSALSKMDEMLLKQDQMLLKQDETIKVVKEESEKTRTELGKKIDSAGVKVDLVGEKVDLLRSDLREYMEVHLSRIREEIAEIKEALRKAGIM